MIILLIFAFLAGLVTVLSPCVLPVLPALLSAGAGKGHLRPIGIVLGVILSFTFFTLLLTAIVHLTGLSPDFLRYIAIALIATFGLMMIFPSLGEKFAEKTSGIANIGSSFQEKAKLFGSGFWSGFILGMALGLVWTPCAGPILASITTLVATSNISWNAFFITLAYSLGSAIPMFLIIYGGKKILGSSKRLSKHAEGIRKGFGVLMILAAAAIAFHYDVKFQQLAIQYIPSINIEDNQIVKDQLLKLKQDSIQTTNKNFILNSQPENPTGQNLPKLAKVPDLVGITGFINSGPFTMESLKGKVVLVDFWTYSCINCIRTFPYLKDWYAKYKDKGLVIVGVHTPEFEFEKNPQNVKEAAERFGLTYPIVLDNDYKTWQNFNNNFWPAHYLVDKEGIVRSFHYGEGAYLETENQIRNLLGLEPIQETIHLSKKETRPITPETYLGFKRASRYINNNQIKENIEQNYSYQDPLQENQVGLRGEWNVQAEKISSGSDESYLDLNFLAPRVYLVMDAEVSTPVTVYLDNKLVESDKNGTSDMNEKGAILVKTPRKYDVINLKGEYKAHKLTLKVPKGVSLYAFTFGDEG